MNAASDDSLGGAIDALGATALRVKRERDALLAAATMARKVIAHDRRVLVDSFKDHRTGRVDDADAKPWLDGYDAALTALDAAIGAAGGRVS